MCCQLVTNEAIAQGALYFEVEMKFCKKCEQWKELSEFHKHKLHKDGLASNCKVCVNSKISEYQKTENGVQVRRKANSKYKKSEKGKISNHRYITTDKVRERYRNSGIKYRASEQGKIKIKEYKHSDNGKQKSKEYRNNNPLQTKARATVSQAVYTNKLPRASTYICKCGKQAQEYHHWSYEKEHWLDVIPLCVQCHADIHRGIYQ